ncbi:MAG TPA: hypothetical protein VNR64_07335 [Vicinamibacterales bacterium]|nr:hypothetical protein [Vicinamibacterales bacterium]
MRGSISKFLEDDFQFVLVSSDSAAAEAWLIYKSASVVIHIGYELGSMPWLGIARLEQADGYEIEVDGVPLPLLLRARGSDVGTSSEPPQDASALERWLSITAASLKANAQDVLAATPSPCWR